MLFVDVFDLCGDDGEDEGYGVADELAVAVGVEAVRAGERLGG